MSIEGSAPSVIQGYAKQFIFNRQQSYLVAQSREEARGAAIATDERIDEVAYRTHRAFLDAERGARVSDLARKQADSLDKVAQIVKSQVDEGRVLPIEGKGRRLTWRARGKRWRHSEPTGRRRDIAGHRVGSGRGSRPSHPGGSETAGMPDLGGRDIQSPVRFNKELRQLESQIVAKGLEIRGDRAARPAAYRPGGAVRTLRQVQSLRGLLPRVPASQRRAGRLLSVPLLPAGDQRCYRADATPSGATPATDDTRRATDHHDGAAGVA